MEIQSLAFRTDLALLQLAGSEVEDHDTHVVVRTPDNPTFRWGNFLLLPSPPAAADVPAWEELFVRAFPGADHRAFGVSTAQGSRDDLAPLVEAGLSVDAPTVMTATSVHEPSRPNLEATYRPLVGDADWEQQVELMLTGEEAADGREFVVVRTAAQRRAVASGAGAWWGAFVGDRLLSSMGLFRASPGLCRFQEVRTRPEARGRGLAGTLVHRISRHGFDELDAHTLVMVADPDDLAIRVYRSVGFEDTETQLLAQRKPSATPTART